MSRLLGNKNPISQNSASDIFDLRNQLYFKSQNNWPLQLKFLGFTEATGSGTAISIDYPVDVQEGDLLFIAGSQNVASTNPTVPTGWTADSISQYAIGYSKVADGTETGANTFTLSSSVEYAYIMYHFRYIYSSLVFESYGGGYEAGGNGVIVSPSNVSGKTNLYMYHGFNATDYSITSVTNNLTFVAKIGAGSRFAAFYYGLECGDQNTGIVISGPINIRNAHYSL